MTFSSNFRQFEYFSWPNAAEIAKTEGSTLVWPFGALEQHGPHLPLATDSFFAEQILKEVFKKLPESFPIWMLPTQSLGFSPEHSSFPGTISLPANLLLQLVMEVGSQISAMGFKRLLFFNAHGGQIGLLQAAARELKMRCPSMSVLPCFLWSGVPSLQKLISSDEQKEDLHAGFVETSLMLSLAPELVGSERPKDGEHSSLESDSTPPKGWSLEGAAPCSWLTNEISVTGVIGDSGKANTLLGEQIRGELVDRWVYLFSSLMESDWPPVGPC